MKSRVLSIFFFALTTCMSTAAFSQIVERPRPEEWKQLVLGARFIDRFLPMKGNVLSSDTWGADCVLPRYVDNGIEDRTWSYWGGNIKKGADGNYHLFVCGWLEASPKGHMEWPNSYVFNAISDNPVGPFKPRNIIGKGHNPEVFQLKDGRYVLYVIDGRYVTDDINGRWEYGKFDFNSRDLRVIEGLSNLTFARREDDSYVMVCRGGGVWISETGLSAYNQLTDKRVYPDVDGRFEDPVIWRDHIQYHLIVNDWLGRIAFYLRSKDGINWVTDPGEAYTPGIAVHEDGRVEDWFKFERLKILQDSYGRAVQANFAVIDTLKHHDKPFDKYSSKNIAIPLNPGLLLTLPDSKPIHPKTKTIRLKIQAEEGFNPQTDIDVSSLRFGASAEVNYGRGCSVLSTQNDGRDLMVTFDARGHGITAEEFAPKLIGKTTSGKMLYGYARLPYVDYQEAILSACAPVFKQSQKGWNCSVEVQNFGQVASSNASLKIEYTDGDRTVQVASGNVPALKPYEKTTLELLSNEDFKAGKKYPFIVTVYSGKKILSTLNVRKVVYENSALEGMLQPFPSTSVTLKPSWIKHREELNITFLQSLEPDRLLHNFRITAGLPSEATPLEGWESPKIGLRGHFVGHYLSAVSHLVEKYHDPQGSERLKYMIDELYKCQQAFGNGYLSAFPEKDFDVLETKFTGVWAPYYTYHKIMQGLLDVYVHTHNKKAYDILLGMAAYVDNRMSKLSKETIEKMLYTVDANPQNEPGAMNEVLYKLYKISNDPKHLALAKVFDRDWYAVPLSENKDILSGLHANTHLVLVNGFAQRYSITKEKKYRDATINFWDMLIHQHAYANGSSSGPRPNETTRTSLSSEHWGVPGQLSNTMTKEIAETCVSHNTQKLTANIFTWTADPKYADAYMNTFYNAVLASQSAHTGAYMYHLPLGSPRNKKYLKENDFACCSGSSAEAYTQLNSGIYYQDEDRLWVNLYIPSEVNWQEKNVRLEQNGNFPIDRTVELSVSTKKKSEFTLNLLVPSWTKRVEVYVNDEKQDIKAKPVSYIALNRIWNNNDKVRLVFEYDFHIQTMPDDKAVLAIFYGPTLLAFENDSELILKGSQDEILRNLRVGSNQTFSLLNNGKTYSLKPLYEIENQPYGVYATIREY